MLWSAETLRSLDCEAADRHAGRITQFYFDEQTWQVRFLVIDAGTWLAADNLLVAPERVRELPADSHTLYLQDRIEVLAQQTPDCLSSPQTVVAQAVEYGLPLLWNCGAVRPARPYPEATEQACAAQINAAAGTAHLQSTEEVAGYRVHAADGLLGHAIDFLIEVPAWRIRYLVVSVHQWRPGKKILLPIDQVQGIAWAPAWAEREIQTDLPRQALREAPAYQPGADFKPTQLDTYYAQARREAARAQAGADRPAAAPG